MVPHDEDIKHKLLFEAHDTPVNGYLGREKTYSLVCGRFWWPHMYKWVAAYVKTYETCRRVKPSPHVAVPLQSLPVPEDCWRSVSMDFVFGYPKDKHGHMGVVVFVCRLSKVVSLAPVRENVSALDTARIFLDTVFRHRGMPEALVSDRDPRFTSQVWRVLRAARHTARHVHSGPSADRRSDGAPESRCRRHSSKPCG